MREETRRLESSIRCLILSMLAFLTLQPLLLAPPAFADSMVLGECRGYRTVPPDTTWRDAGQALAESRCYALEVPAAGWTLVELSVSRGSGGRARLGLHQGPSMPGSGSRIVARSAGQLLLWSDEATVITVWVAASPIRPLGRYKLASRHFGAPESVDDGDVLGDGGRGENEDELEIEPKRGDDAHPLPWPRCPREPIGKGDDHADTFFCATRLHPSRPIAGEIRNAWGDDEDVFTFTLEESHAVRLGLEGPAGLELEVYDALGHRLALESSDGEGALEHHVVLAAGTYYGRLAGSHGAEGPYRLRLDSHPW